MVSMGAAGRHPDLASNSSTFIHSLPRPAPRPGGGTVPRHTPHRRSRRASAGARVQRMIIVQHHQRSAAGAVGAPQQEWRGTVPRTEHGRIESPPPRPSPASGGGRPSARAAVGSERGAQQERRGTMPRTEARFPRSAPRALPRPLAGRAGEGAPRHVGFVAALRGREPLGKIRPLDQAVRGLAGTTWLDSGARLNLASATRSSSMSSAHSGRSLRCVRRISEFWPRPFS